MRFFGLALVGVTAALGALGACGGQPAPTEPVLANHVAGPAAADDLPLGMYRCRIEESGYQYPEYRCVVRFEDGRYTLEKVDGSVRFRGIARPVRGGFAFAGEVFCPWGDCTEPVRGEFRGQSGAFVATFASRTAGPAMTVTLESIPEESFAIDAYGGDAYGGAGYGYGGYQGYGP
jgi:hypothetical protein